MSVNREQWCVVLCAGVAQPPIQPFTSYMPKCFLEVAGAPIVHHTIKAFAKQGVHKFVIVTGANAAYFTPAKREELQQLDPRADFRFVHNEQFWSTGPVASLAIAWNLLKPVAPEDVFVCYGDVVFTEVALEKLVKSAFPNCLVCDRDVGFRCKEDDKRLDLELCMVAQNSEVSQLGRGLDASAAYGEFIGLFRLESVLLDQLLSKVQDGSASVRNAGFYIPEFLRLAIPQPQGQRTPAVTPSQSPQHGPANPPRPALHAVGVFGNWREVHTASDLATTNSDLPYLSNHQEGRKQYIQAIGHRLLAEANDLKRPLSLLSQELNLPTGVMDDLVAGNVELDLAQRVLKKVNKNYPVALSSLWVEPDDCQRGVRIQRASQAEASGRVLSRQDRNGERTPYYEYRDVAMSRLGPFRPEWIKELRNVNDNDPHNPDVAFNNGHLLFQSTFFIGPVNFYYDLGEKGGKVCEPMNTGSSNWISPFVPHTFTNRDPKKEAIIIACTYGAQIITSLQTLSNLGGEEALEAFSGDAREPLGVFFALLERFAAVDNATVSGLADELRAEHAALAQEVLEARSRLPTDAERRVLADALQCQPEDLAVPEALTEPVVVQHRGEGCVRYVPSEKADQKYRFERLACSKHHSLVKSFDVRAEGTSPSSMEWLRVTSHSFYYNHGSTPVTLEWGKQSDGTGKVQFPDRVKMRFEGDKASGFQTTSAAAQSTVIEPGDSFYAQPNVEHRFAPADQRDGSAAAELYLVRIPGNLTRELTMEVSLCDRRGKARIGKETRQWYA